MDNFNSNMDGEYASMSGNSVGTIQEFLGKVSLLPKDKQAKELKKLFGGRRSPAGIGNSRYEMEQKADLLPEDVIKGLLNKRLQLADARFYVVKDISGKNSIDVFIGTDPKAVGVGNLAAQKLEKDNWFLLFAIIMRYAQNDAGALTADFTHIPAIIRNGEFELEAGNKKLVGLVDNTVFDTRDRHDLPIGHWGWHNCKVIEPQVEIKMPVKFTGASVANSFMRVEFVGTAVIPY